jgi:hypothetical protein
MAAEIAVDQAAGRGRKENMPLRIFYREEKLLPGIRPDRTEGAVVQCRKIQFSL